MTSDNDSEGSKTNGRFRRDLYTWAVGHTQGVRDLNVFRMPPEVLGHWRDFCWGNWSER